MFIEFLEQKHTEGNVSTKYIFRHCPPGSVFSTPACSMPLQSTKEEDEETQLLEHFFFSYMVFALCLLTSIALCDSPKQLICHQGPELRSFLKPALKRQRGKGKAGFKSLCYLMTGGKAFPCMTAYLLLSL